MAVAAADGSHLGKVVIVNTADRGGGAERVAMSLVDGFEALGTETWLAVGDKRTRDPRVMPFWLSPHVDYGPHARITRRAALAARRAVRRRLGLEDFEHPYTRYLLQLTGSPPDVVLCNNLHGGYFDLRMLPWLSRRVPVVLRLADCWSFTGHCALPLGCPRWESGCGSCPDLSLPPAVQRDATAANWRRKQAVFASSRLFGVTPSRWLLRRARRSLLGGAVQDWRVIPNGVDVDVFAPGSRAEARRALGLDPERQVVLSVTNLGTGNPYKDFATIRAAVERLAGEPGAPFDLLIVGGDAGIEELSGRVTIRALPYVGSQEELARLYRAADLFVHASREEVFGLAVVEALACGTPVVAAAAGGVEEILDDERCGVLVAPGRYLQLAAALRDLLADPGRRERMGVAGAATARARFDRRRMVADLHGWCLEAARRWGSLRYGMAAHGASR
jgi:glycosyltransferase involved in cell wall biosynthesis